MGIEYRQYMNDESSYRGSSGNWTMVGRLMAANIVIFIAQLLFMQTMSFSEFQSRVRLPAEVSEQEVRQLYQELSEAGRLPKSSFINNWFALDPAKVFNGQIWRLGTYDFLHDTSSIFHLFFNMWLLYLAGKRVEAAYGGKEFLLFYLTAGILSGVFFLFWGVFTGNSVGAVGASGAVVAIMIVYAVHWPQERWYIWGILPIPVMVLAIIAAAMDILPMLNQLRGQPSGSNIAHAAHIGGMLFGFLYAKNNWRLLPWFESLTSKAPSNPFKQKPKLRVHRPQNDPIDLEDEVVQPVSSTSQRIPPDVEARVDQLLGKIAEEGEASLTAEERQFLTDASRRYRDRS